MISAEHVGFPKVLPRGLRIGRAGNSRFQKPAMGSQWEVTCFCRGQKLDAKKHVQLFISPKGDGQLVLVLFFQTTCLSLGKARPCSIELSLATHTSRSFQVCALPGSNGKRLRVFGMIWLWVKKNGNPKMACPDSGHMDTCGPIPGGLMFAQYGDLTHVAT